VYWYISGIFLADDEPPNVAGLGVAYSYPTLSTGLLTIAKY